MISGPAGGGIVTPAAPKSGWPWPSFHPDPGAPTISSIPAGLRGGRPAGRSEPEEED
jgi:hypothetical protein